MPLFSRVSPASYISYLILLFKQIKFVRLPSRNYLVCVSCNWRCLGNQANRESFILHLNVLQQNMVKCFCPVVRQPPPQSFSAFLNRRADQDLYGRRVAWQLHEHLKSLIMSHRFLKQLHLTTELKISFIKNDR